MRSRWAFAAAAVLTATAAVAIATTTGGGETSTTSAPSRPSVALGERAAREALALWDRFPAGAKPRPIVIPFSRGIVNAPRSQHEDLALYHATWKLMAPRATDLAVARHYHWISAAAATIALRSDLKHRPTPSSKLTVHVLLGRASFVTDRGRRDLPAWEFSFGRFREPASVLAIVPFSAPALRRLDPDAVGNSQDGEQAVISAGGRTLAISFIGGHAGNRPCDDSYSATASQSPRAVAFTIYEHPAPAPPNAACAGVGYQRTAVAPPPPARRPRPPRQHRRRRHPRRDDTDLPLNQSLRRSGPRRPPSRTRQRRDGSAAACIPTSASSGRRPEAAAWPRRLGRRQGRCQCRCHCRLLLSARRSTAHSGTTKRAASESRWLVSLWLHLGARRPDGGGGPRAFGLVASVGPGAIHGSSGFGPRRRAFGSAIGSMMSDAGAISRAAIVIVTSWWRRTATQ